MNGQVEVTWRTLRKIAHFLIVHARVLEAYIHFTRMYTTDHIFPHLPIHDMINEDSNLTTPFKLATGTKPSVSHLHIIFFHVLYIQLHHTVKKVVEYLSSSAKGFRGFFLKVIVYI